MRLILFGDIHGNVEALKATILDAIKNYETKIDGFVFLGDYCCDFLEGEECIQLMKQLAKVYPVYAINGNRETNMVIPYKNALEDGSMVNWSIDSTMGAALLSCKRMSLDTLQYLASLPSNGYLTFEGVSPLYLQHKMPLTKEKQEELKNMVAVIF